MLGGAENDRMRNKGVGTCLLQQIQPVAQGNPKSDGTLTEKSIPRKLRWEGKLDVMQHMISESGWRIAVNDVERQIRKGLLGLQKVFKRNNITVRGFIKLYKEVFTMNGGIVTVRNGPACPAPAPNSSVTSTSNPAPQPLLGTTEFNALPIEERSLISGIRNYERKRVRQETSRAKVGGVGAVYG